MTQNLYLDIYDEIYFHLWDVTTAQANTPRECYRGAKCFARFLLSEVRRYQSVREAGESSIERRGLASPQKIMAGWACAILDDCHINRCAPPRELIEALEQITGIASLVPTWRGSSLRVKYLQLVQKNPQIGVREAARILGVNASNISRIKKEFPDSYAAEAERNHASLEYRRIREMTRVNSFYPIAYRANLENLAEV